MPKMGEAHRLLSGRHPDTQAPAAGADPDDGQVATWSAALEAWIAADPTGGGVTDHGLLTGLTDDDHPHYALADKSRPSPWVAAADLAARSIADLGTKDHGLLDGLDADGHSIYALLSGRSGGQSLIGGLAASEHLTLQSTAHATRGYVRAQDDLQLLSNILRDAVGTARATLAAASPHVTLTGQTKITDYAAIGGAAIAPTAVLVVQPLPNPATAYLTGIYGLPVAVVPSGGTAGVVRGLNYQPMISGGGADTIMPELTAMYLRDWLLSYTGTLTAAYGLRIDALAVSGGTPSVTDYYLAALTASASNKVANFHGLVITDPTNFTLTAYLLELGPATKYLRVIGGAAPGAGLSNLELNVGGTLYQVRTRTLNGYTALTID